MQCDAAEQDVQLTFTWHPRETANQQKADALSKHIDNSQVALKSQVFEQLIAQDPVVLQRGGLWVDAFADEWSAKLAQFWAPYWCPGACAVDAWAQDWSRKPDRAGLMYINAPWHDLAKVLCKVQKEKADAVIMFPTWNKSWQSMWHHLPVKKVITLPQHHGLLTAGPRTKQPGEMATKFTVKAAIVIWDK